MHSKEPHSYSCLDAKNVLEPDPDDSEGGKSSNSKLCIGTRICQGPYTYGKAELIECRLNGVVLKNGTVAESDSDDMLASEMVKDVTNYEPDPDDHDVQANLEYENTFEPDPDDSQRNSVICAEPDPDDSQENYSTHVEPDPDDSQGNCAICAEPDPDDSQGKCVICAEPDPDDSQGKCVICAEPDPDDSQGNCVICAEPDPDDKSGIPCFASSFETLSALKMLTSHVLYASKPDSVLSTIKASTHDALTVGGFQVRPMEAATLLGTVVKIIALLRSVVVCFFFHYDSLLQPMFSAGGNCSALLLAISAAALGEVSEIEFRK